MPTTGMRPRLLAREMGGRRRPVIVDPCVLKEEVMQSMKLEPLSSRARVACAAFALVCSLATVSFIIVLFASASGGSDPPSATLKSEPVGAVAAKQRPAKSGPG